MYRRRSGSRVQTLW